MTRDRARKKAIRERMASSGEPYVVAARQLAATGPASEAVAVRTVIARAEHTLAAPSARIEIRLDLDGIWSQPGERRPALLFAPGQRRRQGRMGGRRIRQGPHPAAGHIHPFRRRGRH